MSINDNTLLTVHETADFLRLNQDTVTALARRGSIRASRIAARWRFTKEDLLQYLEDGRKRG